MKIIIERTKDLSELQELHPNFTGMLVSQDPLIIQKNGKDHNEHGPAYIGYTLATYDLDGNTVCNIQFDIARRKSFIIEIIERNHTESEE